MSIPILMELTENEAPPVDLVTPVSPASAAPGSIVAARETEAKSGW